MNCRAWRKRVAPSAERRAKTLAGALLPGQPAGSLRLHKPRLTRIRPPPKSSQSAANIPHHIFRWGTTVKSPHPCPCRILFELFADRAHFGVRLFTLDAWTQSGNDAPVVSRSRVSCGNILVGSRPRRLREGKTRCLPRDGEFWSSIVTWFPSRSAFPPNSRCQKP